MTVINNNIQETYVSFEVAKLLKENGFGVYCKSGYDLKGNDYSVLLENHNLSDHKISRPTQSISVEWVRVNFGIMITFDSDVYGLEYYPVIKCVSKDNWHNLDKRHAISSYFRKMDKSIFDTPQESIEASLIYVLKNVVNIW